MPDQQPPKELIESIAGRIRGLQHSGWVKLSGGRTNMAWRARRDEGDDVVIKLYTGAALNPLFPNEPASEAKLLQLLDGQGFAPRFIGSVSTNFGVCNVYSHLPGSTWSTGPETVARLMQRLHGLDSVSHLRKTPDGTTELVGQTETILAECANVDGLVQFKPRGSVAPSTRNCLLHGDIVPGNLILNAAGLHLIDWQCPATGDPCEDIAMFLSPAMQHLYRGKALSQSEVDAFLAAYAANDVADRYRSLSPWYHWRMAAYCQWQSENGRPDYAKGRDLEIAALQRSAIR